MAFGWKKWTKANLTRLETLLARGVPIEKIRFRGKKPEYVRRKARELGLIPTRGFPSLTPEEKRDLRELVAQGFGAKAIVERHMLGEDEHLVNQNYIQKCMGDLRLVNKNRSRAAKKRRVLKPAESRELNEFILQHPELSARKIAKKYGLETETISARQRQLGVKLGLPEVMQLPETRRRYLAGMRRRKKRIIANFPSRIAEYERKLCAKAEEIRNDPDLQFDEKACNRCGKPWLRHSAFFFPRKYRPKRGAGIRSHFSSPCKVCKKRERHQKWLQKLS